MITCACPSTLFSSYDTLKKCEFIYKMNRERGSERARERENERDVRIEREREFLFSSCLIIHLQFEYGQQSEIVINNYELH